MDRVFSVGNVLMLLVVFIVIGWVLFLVLFVLVFVVFSLSWVWLLDSVSMSGLVWFSIWWVVVLVILLGLGLFSIFSLSILVRVFWVLRLLLVESYGIRFFVWSVLLVIFEF